MAKSEPEFETLGEKLTTLETPQRSKTPLILALSLAIGLLSAFIFGNPMLGFGAFVFCAAVLFAIAPKGHDHRHLLTRFDQQGFMSGLKLSQKTVVFDGSNIYHFGLDHEIGAMPLGALVSALRSEGYRIVCFFDANIYFTLLKNGAFKKAKGRFSIRIIEHIFELKANEIYIVPKGEQADSFIVETLFHLPISFAVTNDRYRDYEAKYSFLASDNQWRKGVRVQGRQLKLYQHKFKNPLIMVE